MRTALPCLVLALLAGCTGDTSPLPNGDPCATDDDCPSAAHCEAGACKTGSGNQCETDDGCPAHELCQIVTDCGAARCHGNTCVPRACQNHEECPTRFCQAGACAATPSCDGALCPEGFVCGDALLCQPGCTDDDQCGALAACVEGLCVPIVTCESTADCPTDQRCHAGRCGPPCASNDDCGSARFGCDTGTGECYARCFGDRLCPSGQICESNRCGPAECAESPDCGAVDQRCAGGPDHGRCETFVVCQGPADCPANHACTGGECVELPGCVGDRSCGPEEYCADGHCQPTTRCPASPCAAGLECIAERCVPAVCRADTDCAGDQICLAGACADRPSPATITDVKILTPASTIRPGAQVPFVAVALNQAGGVVPGVRFSWRSFVPAVATLDRAGVATGGAQAGETFVTASVFTNSSTITSSPVSLVNLGLAGAALRVTVVRAHDGAKVGGAVVSLDDGRGPTVLVADGGGQIEAEDVRFPISITVAHPGYDYVTLHGVDGGASGAADLLVSLPSASAEGTAGGLQGTIEVPPGEGALRIGLGGASFPAPLFTFEPLALFGPMWQRSIALPNAPGFNVPVPAGTTLEVSLFGFDLPIKDEFYAETRPGLRAAWAFGGRLGEENLGEIGAQLQQGLGGILPYLQTFSHAVRPALPVVSLPKVADTKDVDGDGDTVELVADYASFPNVALAPSVAQTLRFFVRANGARLPFVTGGNANTLLVLAGAIVPGAGFVPLGFDGVQDDGGNGVVPDLLTKMAPPHGGLETGRYAVLVSAVRFAGRDLPGPGSARVLVTPTLPSTIDVSDGWLDVPSGSFDPATRTLTANAPAGAELLHVRFGVAEGAWHHYLLAGAGPVVLPAPPMGLADRIGPAAAIDAIDLHQPEGLGQLFDVARGGERALDDATRGFSRGAIAP